MDKDAGLSDGSRALNCGGMDPECPGPILNPGVHTLQPLEVLNECRQQHQSESDNGEPEIVLGQGGNRAQMAQQCQYAQDQADPPSDDLRRSEFHLCITFLYLSSGGVRHTVRVWQGRTTCRMSLPRLASHANACNSYVILQLILPTYIHLPGSVCLHQLGEGRVGVIFAPSPVVARYPYTWGLASIQKD